MQESSMSPSIPTPPPVPPVAGAGRVDALLAQAYEAGLGGDAAGAIALLRQAVALEPANVEALDALAQALAQDGDWASALPIFEAGWRLEPGRPSWARGLVAALIETGRGDRAQPILATALAARGDDATLHRLAARLAFEGGQGGQALAHAREACHLAPHDLAGIAAMAPILTASGEALAAAEMLAPLLAHAHPADPALPGGHVALGRVWAALSEPEKAARHWRQALELDPRDAAGAGPLLAGALEGGAGLSPAYVRALFDRYADRFDADLTQKLRYQVPDLLRQALDALDGERRLAGEPGLWRDGGLDILDLGCGTGLAGVALADRARTLAGVDLSPRMVERAREKRVYHRLTSGDLMLTLAQADAAWDLALAADVLVYLGDLAPVLAAVARALRQGGRFAATIERWEGDGDFHLHEGRRYAHAAHHARAAAASAGLTVERLDPVVPRWEKGGPVAGLLMILRK